MKTIRVIAILFIVLFSFFLFIGMFVKSHIELKNSIIIEAPRSAVWKLLSEDGSLFKWSSYIEVLENESNSKTVLSYYINDKKLKIPTHLYLNNREQIINLTQAGPANSSIIQDLQNKLRLKQLSDGSCEITWETTYHINPLFARAFNKLFVIDKLKTIIRNDLQQLKNKIEYK